MAGNEDEVVEGLDRVLTRLAMTEEDKLEQVLSKLIPAVIRQLQKPTEKVQKKVLEILQHVNTRIRAHPQMQLPLDALITLFNSPEAAPPVRSFSLVYIDMAFSQSNQEAQSLVVPKLLDGISRLTSQQANMLLRLAVWGLEEFKPPRPKFGSDDSVRDAMFAAFSFLKSDSDLTVFLGYCLKFLLYQPPGLVLRHRKVETDEGAQQDPDAMQVDQETPTEDSNPPVPQGLSQDDIKVLEGKKAPAVAELGKRKLGILKFLSAVEINANKTVLHYAVAACDPQENTSKQGEDIFRRNCRVDTVKGDLDLEDKLLVRAIFRLFLGKSTGTLQGLDGVEPAGYALRSKLLGLLVKSMAAANSFPENIEVIRQCLFGAGTTKLKRQGMEFAVWVLRHADSRILQGVAPQMLQELLTLLDADPQKAANDSAASTLRGFIYQAVGQMAQKVPSVFSCDPKIAERMFLSLPGEPAGVRAQVQEAISVMATSYKESGFSERDEIESLLVRSFESSEAAVRLCAVQWAVKLFPYKHISARYICVLGAGDSKVEVADEAQRGLRKDEDPRLRPLISTDKVERSPEDDELPDLKGFLEYLQVKLPSIKKPAAIDEPLLLSPASYIALMDLLKSCWQNACECAPPSSALISEYCNALEHAIIRDSTRELISMALESIIKIGESCEEIIALRYQQKVDTLKSFLSHVDYQVRFLAARLLGIAAQSMSTSAVVRFLDGLQQSIDGDSKGKKFDAKDGAVGASGFILAQCAIHPQLPTSTLQKCVSDLTKLLEDESPHIRASAAIAIGHVGLRGMQVLDVQSKIPHGAIIEKLIKLLGESDHKVVVNVVKGIGFLCRGLPNSSDAKEKLIDGLLAQNANKVEEVQFAIGEALSFAFGSVLVTADTLLKSPFKSLEHSIVQIDTLDSGQDTPMPDAGSRVPDAPEADVPSQSKILMKIFELVVHSRIEVRSAGCVWLVCILAFTTKTPQILQHLEQIQSIFLGLIGDSSELTQEMASRGLSLVYSLGDVQAREKLVAGITGVLQGGSTSVKRMVKMDGDTAVFEDGQLGKSPGGAGMSTYKELCALATDLGQPDLMYKFMDLANHQAALNSKRGAAFGFAKIAKMAGEQLQPHISKLIPKLYRYQFDPNGKVQESMTYIWQALVPDPKRAVDENFDVIMKELLKEMGSRLWRNRESGCKAVSDLLQGRKWEHLSKYIEDIWTMTLRVIDDIKESTRQSGWVLMRTLKGLTLRLADTSHTSTKDAKSAVALILPLLLQKGVQSSVSEVRALTVDIIAKMAKAAGPGPLQPLLPDLVHMMLESLSGLESAKLNYIEQNAQAMGIDSNKLESLRVSASKSTPMQDTLDLCVKYVSTEVMALLVPKLVELIRAGVGLNTKVGTARFIAQLATRMGTDFTPHTAAFSKALLSKSMSEQSYSVKKAYASTLALVMQHATGRRVEKIVQDTLKTYQEQSDRDMRQTAGLIFKELIRQASTCFQDHASSIIPVAFFAKYDSDENVASVWKGVWEEGVTSDSAAARIYAKELAEGLVLGLTSSQWGKKAAAAEATSTLCQINSEAMQPYVEDIKAHLLKEVPGRIWEGKEKVLQGLASLCESCPKQLVTSSENIAITIKKACEKGKKEYREVAVECLIRCLKSFEELDVYDQVAPMLLEACERHISERNSAKSEEEDPGPAPLPLKPSIQCLAAAWAGATPASQMNNGSSLSSCLRKILCGMHAWHIRLVAAESAKEFAENVKQDAAGSATIWLEDLIKGAMECTQEPKYQQLRIAGLRCLGTCWQSPGGGKLLSTQCVSEMQERLKAVIEQDKAAAAVAHASTVLDLLPDDGVMLVDS